MTTMQPGTGSMTAAALPRRDQLILALGLAVRSLIAGHGSPAPVGGPMTLGTFLSQT